MSVKRRGFLTTVGTLVIPTVSGCSSVREKVNDGAESESIEEQKAVIERFVAAVNENDVTTVEESVRGWASGGFTEENIDEYSLDYDELERAEQEGSPGMDRGGNWFRTDLTITHNGEELTDDTVFVVGESPEGWVIESIHVELIIGGTTLGPPIVFIETSYDADATNDSNTGVLTLTHRGGVPVLTTGMKISGTIVDVAGADVDMTSPGNVREATGESEFDSGDTLTVGVENEYYVEVLYMKQGTDETALLKQISAE